MWRPPLLLAVLVACAEPAPDVGGRDGTVPALQFDGFRPRNLLFISIDTLRRDHVGPWSTLGLTPFLADLADDGLVLDNHLQCANWTMASVTCTLAGRTDIDRGHLPRLQGQPEQVQPVPEGTPLLAGWLGEAGFVSVGVSSNSYFGQKGGNHQGYDRFDRFGGGGGNGWDKGVANLEEIRGDSRWFLHVHLLEPHEPYMPPDGWLDTGDLAPWPYGDLRWNWQRFTDPENHSRLTSDEATLLEAHLRALYAAEVRYTDSLVEGFIADAQRRGLLDDTLVVVWSDHGEQFWEHGAQSHAHRLHPEENDGAVIFWAKNLRPGRYEGPTHAIDMAPTVLQALGLDIPAEITGSAVGTEDPDRLRFTGALARDGGVQAVHHGTRSLHYHWASGTLTSFDRATDPHEQHDLYDPSDAEIGALWDALRPAVDGMAELVVDGDPAPVWPVLSE